MIIRSLGLLLGFGSASAFGALPASSVTTQPTSARALIQDARLALELNASGRHADAVPLLRAVTTANPWHGEAWAALGHALLATGAPAAAIPALETALDIGVTPDVVNYNLACAYARLGNHEKAVASLERAIDAQFNDWNLLATDGDLDSIRDLPRFREILGVPPEGLTREQRWAHDLNFLAWRMERLHINLYAHVTREAFRGDLEELKRDVASLSDERIILRLQKIIARVGDGHTRVQQRNGEANPRYPIGLYSYSDGLFVRMALPEAEAVLGARVESIGGRPIEEVLDAVSAYVSHDNEFGVRRLAPFFLSQPAMMQELGLAEEDGSVRYGFLRADGAKLEIKLGPSTGPWSQRLLANRGATGSLPLYLKHFAETFGFKFLSEEKLIYVWINEIANARDETFSDFVNRLFDGMDAHQVEALVLDVRNNGGGNNFLNRSLIRRLADHPAINRRGKLFVITGRLTFSAAIHLVTDLSLQTEALVVGEPGAAGPNSVGEVRTIVLPCSRVEVRCSTQYWQRTWGWDHRRFIWPDIPAELSSDDFANNRDPALDAIRAYLGAH